MKAGDIVVVAHTISDLRNRVMSNESNKYTEHIKHICSDEYLHRFYTSGNCAFYEFVYLVKRAEEKKWRPYKDCDEMIVNYTKRFDGGCPVYKFPSIWLKGKVGGIYFITTYHSDVVFGDKRCTLKEVFDNYIYPDGSPCGAEE